MMQPSDPRDPTEGWWRQLYAIGGGLILAAILAAALDWIPWYVALVPAVGGVVAIAAGWWWRRTP